MSSFRISFGRSFTTGVHVRPSARFRKGPKGCEDAVEWPRPETVLGRPVAWNSESMMGVADALTPRRRDQQTRANHQPASEQTCYFKVSRVS